MYVEAQKTLLWEQKQLIPKLECEKTIHLHTERLFPLEPPLAFFFLNLCQHCQIVSKWQKNSTSNPKIISHLEMDIFCHFKFCQKEEISLDLKHHKERHFLCLAHVAKETEQNVVKLVKLLSDWRLLHKPSHRHIRWPFKSEP